MQKIQEIAVVAPGAVFGEKERAADPLDEWTIGEQGKDGSARSNRQCSKHVA